MGGLKDEVILISFPRGLILENCLFCPNAQWAYMVAFWSLDLERGGVWLEVWGNHHYSYLCPSVTPLPTVTLCVFCLLKHYSHFKFCLRSNIHIYSYWDNILNVSYNLNHNMEQTKATSKQCIMVFWILKATQWLCFQGFGIIIHLEVSSGCRWSFSNSFYSNQRCCWWDIRLTVTQSDVWIGSECNGTSITATSSNFIEY